MMMSEWVIDWLRAGNSSRRYSAILHGTLRYVHLSNKSTPFFFVKTKTAVSKIIISFKSLCYFRFTFAVIKNSRSLHFTKKCTPIYFVKSLTAVFKAVISFFKPFWYLHTTNMENLPADNAVRIKTLTFIKSHYKW